MQYMVYVFMSVSIVIAAIIGGVRFSKIDPAFYPFIIYTWVASINELASYAISKSGHPTNINNNVYVLAEAIIITWQAYRWGLFNSYQWLYKILMASYLIFWSAECYILKGPQNLFSFFRIYYAACLIILFINHSNRLLFTFTIPVYKNAGFLIATGFIFFYTFKILMETFWLLGVNGTDTYLFAVFTIIAWMNLLVNILFIIAVLCIPLRPNYITFS